MLLSFSKAWNLCDVTLQTEDGISISAHRNVLSVDSPYFKAMFTGHLKERRKEVITLKGVSGEALRCIVRPIRQL